MNAFRGRHGLMVAVAVVACCATSAVRAAAGAEARISNLTFHLQDLDSNDGIAPSFSFVNDPDVNRFRTELTVDVENTLLGTSDGAISAAFEFIGALDLARAVAGNQAVASSTATSALAWVLSEARGHASAFSSAESNLLFSGDFGLKLSPNTSITITADAKVTAFDSGAPGAQGFAFEFARAESYLRVRAGDPGDGSGLQESLSERTAETLVDPLGDAVDMSGPLSVSFKNLSANPLYGYLSVRSTAAGYGVTPVPEPQTYALMLAGLCVIGAFARRRGKSRS